MSLRISATIHRINPAKRTTRPLMIVLRCCMDAIYHNLVFGRAPGATVAAGNSRVLEYAGTEDRRFQRPRLMDPAALPLRTCSW